MATSNGDAECCQEMHVDPSLCAVQGSTTTKGPLNMATKLTPSAKHRISSATPALSATVTAAAPRPRLKKSESLATFFGGTDHRVPEYFYLDWLDESAEPSAIFLASSPPRAQVVGVIQWRQAKRPITLCCSPDVVRGVGWNPPAERTYSRAAEQLLKSHMQKCVRRSLSELAVDTAAHLMRLNLSELLQRLGVIIIEDAALFDGFPVLVWLMAAELKGFKLCRHHYSWVLGVVHAAAACKHRDCRHMADDFNLSQVSKRLKNPKHKALIYSLVLRRDYKCMAGKVIMTHKVL